MFISAKEVVYIIFYVTKKNLCLTF